MPPRLAAPHLRPQQNGRQPLNTEVLVTVSPQNAFANIARSTGAIAIKFRTKSGLMHPSGPSKYFSNTRIGVRAVSPCIKHEIERNIGRISGSRSSDFHCARADDVGLTRPIVEYVYQLRRESVKGL